MSSSISTQFSILADFANASQVDIGVLEAEINLDPTLVASGRTCTHCTTVGSDTVIIYMDAPLTGQGDIDALAAVVAAYTYLEVPPPPNNQYEANRAPLPTDDETSNPPYSAGSMWQVGKRQWMCDFAGAGAAIWQTLNMRYQSTVVAADGSGDYLTVGAATAAGVNSIFVKNGLYYETGTIALTADGAQIIGETMGGVILAMVGGNSLVCDAHGGTVSAAGTISIAHGANQVVGTGTAFLSSGLSPGDYIVVLDNSYIIASIESDLNLTIGDVYNGNVITDRSYSAHSMLSGVRLNNLIVVGSSAVGVFLRGLRNSTVYGVAAKSCTPNFHLSDCCRIGLINGASESSVGDGIVVDACISVNINTVGASNCKGSGMAIINGSSGIIVGGSSCNSNEVHGIHIASASTSVNINDSVVRTNNGKGVYGDPTTGFVVVVNCEASDNGAEGIDILGPANSISDSPIINNGSHGINVGDRSIINNNHVTGNAGDGLNLVTSNDCVASANTVNGNGGHGISVSGNHNNIGLNRILNNVGWAIDIVVGGMHNMLAFNSTTANAMGGIQDAGTRTRHSSSVTYHAVDPAASDDFATQLVQVGDMWLNTSSGRVFVNMVNAAGVAQWSGGVAAPIAPLSASTANAAGSALSFAASDHSHAFDFAIGKGGGLLIAGGSGTGENLELRANAADSSSGVVLVHAPLVRRVDVPTTKTAGLEVTLTAAEMLGGCVAVDPSAAHDLKTATAADIVAAMGTGASVGDSFMLLVAHAAATSAFPVTLTCNTGATFTFGNAVVSNSSAGTQAGSFLIRLSNVTALSEAVEIYRYS